MCDRSNAKQIVAEMLSYLETADYSIREEMVGGRLSSSVTICNYYRPAAYDNLAPPPLPPPTRC